MKGIKYFKDIETDKRFVQIDLAIYEEYLQDFFDVLAAEERKDDKKYRWAK